MFIFLQAFMKEIESWIEKAGGGITYEFVQVCIYFDFIQHLIV